MIRLRRPQENLHTVRLAPGCLVSVRPATSYDFERAKQAIARLHGAANDVVALAAAYGLPFTLPEAAEVESSIHGLSHVVIWTETALACIDSWDGILAEDGTPAPVDRPHVALLMMQPAYGDAIIEAISRDLHEVASEGNDSTASSHGAQVAEMPIAPTAGATEMPAP